MAAVSINWSEHCELLAIKGGKKLLSGQLSVIVAFAQDFDGGLDGLFIKTDSGALFCTNEIRLLSLDNNRFLPS